MNNNEVVLPSEVCLEDFNNFYLIDEIDYANTTDLIKFIHKREFLNIQTPIDIYINSDGGSLYPAWAAIDCILKSPLCINTICMGRVCSAATMIFLAGTYRKMYKHSCCMMHQHTNSISGKFHEIESMDRMNKIMNLDMKGYLRSRTNLSKQEVDLILLGCSDNWLTAKQCLQYGIANKII